MTDKLHDKLVDIAGDAVGVFFSSLFGIKQPTYDSAIEESIYNLCKEHAHKDDKKFIFEGLHKAFTEVMALNKTTPSRIHRELRRAIYKDVAKIENTEVRDNVIFQYALIFNLDPKKGKAK